MKSTKNSSKVLVACIALISIVALLKADYYEPDFFPIGLTGTMYTGSGQQDNCPYSNVSAPTRWAWDGQVKSESTLVVTLGINCIGSEDTYYKYLANYNTLSGDSANNYLRKVCMPSMGTNNPIYLIPANYFVTVRKRHLVDTVYLDSCTYHEFDITDTGSSKNISASGFFRSPYRAEYGGWGSMIFSHYYDNALKNGDWGCHGIDYDNWKTCDYDTLWQEMADEAITNFEDYYEADNQRIKAVWGYNLITEDPTNYRHSSYMPCWRGCWGAVDRILTGHHGSDTLTGHTDSPFLEEYGDPNSVPHAGIRGVETYSSPFEGKHRMVVVKGGTWPMHREGYNIFEALPDIDVIVLYTETWCEAKYNYGEQVMFDNLLYDDSAEIRAVRKGRPGQYEKAGFHNTAIYFQQYANTYLAYSDQKRRWIPGLGTKWSKMNSSGTIAYSRRPCPPELRCAVYLCLSRGAKGILFHQWTRHNTLPSDTFPNVPIPCTTYATDTNRIVVLRDYQGYPFGDTFSAGSSYVATNHKLNSGQGGSTYWHTNNTDYTYLYLKDDLIPEIKKIAPKLMQLDWVNAYSLNSTSPEWRSPCPHYYMEDVWGVDYMDVAFFEHPYEPVGVEYFMMVNREGIADMTNRNVGVSLDANHWPEEDTLILTDIANADNPRKLKRVGERFTFTEVFEPGEGKLYRVAPVNEASIVLVPSTEGGVR